MMRHKEVLLIVLVIVLCFSSTLQAGTYSGGDGTAENPYQIGTVDDWFELMESYWDWGQNFILMEDLDFSGELLSPVGTSNYPFVGVFGGQNHIIRYVTINKPTGYHVGLFGHIGTAGKICNMGVEDMNIIGLGYVGGLVGYNEGTIISCHATGVIGGDSYFGGLAGYNGGTITSCYATCAISGHYTVGGLIGENNGSLSYCFATGNVCGIQSNVGGLVGWNDGGTLTSCYAVGMVEGGGYTGGLIGANGQTWNPKDSLITNCYATGPVTGTNYAGGLIGLSTHGVLADCNATGSVAGTESVGGLIGHANRYNTITFCYAKGLVNGTGNNIGGLVGYSCDDEISACYATGSVRGNKCIGGLVGRKYYGTISRCYATGLAVGIYTESDTGRYVGGLVGYNEAGGITTSYARGDVMGDTVGGLVGHNWGWISSSYSTGAIYGYGGGLLGYGTSVDVSCFWDMQTSGKTYSCGGTGKTTAQMKTLATFTDPIAAWDISDMYNVPSVWKMPINDYPHLAWEDLPANLEVSNIPESLSIGIGEPLQFDFTIYRKAVGGDTVWTVMADSNCPWVDNIDPNSGSVISPEDSNTVTVTIDTRELEPGNYPIRLLVSDGYIFYEVLSSMHLFNRVNLDEFALLADYWMIIDCNESQPCSDADWYIDGKINLRDFAQLAQSWLGEEVLLDRPGLRDYFESGTFNDLPWEHGGNASWVIIAGDNKYEGSYAAQPGWISDFQTSTLTLSMNAEDGSQVDSISFARKVSSEPSYDYLRFYIDGVEKAKWSGEQDWAVVTYTFTPGAHTFKWAYTKDGSASAGSDRAWIDAVRIYPKP